MQAFRNAILAEDQVAQNELDNLCGLRESIGYALGLYDDKFRFFEQYGLTRDTLTDFDKDIEFNMHFPEKSGYLTAAELDTLIPFVFKMGQAYSQLMADSFVTNPNNAGTTAIEYACRLSPILNFFYAQKAKMYPTATNEPSFKNE